MISLIEAKPGQGKSVYATYRILELLAFKKNTKVATNIDIVLTEKQKKTARFYKVVDWTDIKKLMYEHIEGLQKNKSREGTLVIILDELSLLLDANNWDSLPQQVKFLLRQHRKFGVDIIGFSQSVKDIDTKYRRLVQKLYVVKKLFVWSLFTSFGFFWVREFDSDDIDKDRQDRRPLSIISSPPEFVFADSSVFRAMDSWQILELTMQNTRVVEHVQLLCSIHGENCKLKSGGIIHV